jgi:hypothetical protein
MPGSPDIFTLGDDIGLVTAAEMIARKAWAGRLDPGLYDWARRGFAGCHTAGAAADVLWRRLRQALFAEAMPDADDFAVMMAAACLACGWPVRLILVHQKGVGREQMTMLVSVRVAFSLDPEQDRVESWHVYGPEGRYEWPSALFDAYVYVAVEQKVEAE